MVQQGAALDAEVVLSEAGVSNRRSREEGERCVWHARGRASLPGVRLKRPFVSVLALLALAYHEISFQTDFVTDLLCRCGGKGQQNPPDEPLDFHLRCRSCFRHRGLLLLSAGRQLK